MEKPPPPPTRARKQLHESSFDNIKAIKVLGKGAMGTVFLVHNIVSDPKAQTPYALKVVEKSDLQTKFDADRRARWEINVLSRLSVNHHPFLPHLISSIETPDFLAWSVPFCPGGDLNVLRHRQNDRVFSCSVVRFYLAEIICALEQLHNMGIVYRDLKPENILIQQSGHVTLTDFDLSRSLAKNTKSFQLPFEIETNPEKLNPKKPNHKRWFALVPHNYYSNDNKTGLKKTKSARVSPVSRRKSSFSTGERSNSFVGTEEYVSPEVVRGDGHEFAVDWWALGILSYEMLYGTTPFKGKNRKETFRNVLMKKPEFGGMRNELTDLIERLLEKDPTRRLGYQRGASEIKGHVFFKGLKWDLLTEVMRPPFIPSTDDVIELTEKVTAGAGFDIGEYFQKLREAQFCPPSPLPSPSSEFQRQVSFTEF